MGLGGLYAPPRIFQMTKSSGKKASNIRPKRLDFRESTGEINIRARDLSPPPPPNETGPVRLWIMSYKIWSFGQAPGLAAGCACSTPPPPPLPEYLMNPKMIVQTFFPFFSPALGSAWGPFFEGGGGGGAGQHPQSINFFPVPWTKLLLIVTWWVHCVNVISYDSKLYQAVEMQCQRNYHLTLKVYSLFIINQQRTEYDPSRRISERYKMLLPPLMNTYRCDVVPP